MDGFVWKGFERSAYFSELLIVHNWLSPTRGSRVTFPSLPIAPLASHHIPGDTAIEPPQADVIEEILIGHRRAADPSRPRLRLGARCVPVGGFSVDQSVRLPAGDQAGIERLTQYMTRCPKYCHFG